MAIDRPTLGDAETGVPWPSYRVTTHRDMTLIELIADWYTVRQFTHPEAAMRYARGVVEAIAESYDKQIRDGAT